MKRANVGPVLAWCLVFPLIFVSSAFGQSCNRFIGRWKSPNVFMQTVDELTIAKDGDGFLVVGHVSYGEFNGKFPAECQEGKLVLSVKQFGDIVYSNERDVLYFGGKEFHRVVGGPPAGGAGVDRTRKAEKAAVPSSEYPLAGIWKTQCSNNFGLAIAPAGDRYYSISFCGPGGCAEPGTYRPNSRIVNDPNYRAINNDTIEVQGKDGFSRYLRCLTPATPPQPSVPVAVTCSDYDSCFRGGTAAYRSGQLDQSLGYFQKASTLDPSKGDAWAGIGAVYFETARYDEAATMFDKALALGSTVTTDVCRQHLMSCDRGSFRMSTREVSLVSARGQKVFSATPSEVTTQGAQLFALKEAAYVGVRVSGKNYSLFYIPDRITCNFGLVPECPEPGFTQQKLFANYVHRTIQRMAAGEFAKTVQPPTPKAGCDAATDLGYSLLAGGHLYKVKGIASPSGGQVHVFFDEKGSLVQDQNLLQKLALGAWTRENVVGLPSARADIQNAIQRVSGILGTSQALQRYEIVQDVLARAMTEAIEAAVTGGTTLNKAVPNLAWSTVRAQLASPRTARTVLTLAAQIGLQSSLEKYKQLQLILPPADATALDVGTLEKVKDLYIQAQALELPNEALAAALMPKSAQELTDQALQSILSELIAGLPNANEAVTLQGLLTLDKSLATFGQTFPALQTYSERLNLALNLAQANDRRIDEWAQLAAGACSP